MSKVIAINAQATYATPSSVITITNSYNPTVEEISALAELGLPLKADDVWNTGLASLGDPHIDEIARGVGDTAIVTDGNAWLAKHIASFRLFKTNSFVYLLPGDSITIKAQSAEEAVYYVMLHDELLTVTSDLVTEGGEHVEPEVQVAAQLGRTTGVGDFDDGNDDNGVYPFQFDTEAATPQAPTYAITVTNGTADVETAKAGVTVTVTPSGSETTITSDPEVEFTEGSGNWTFVMPASDIAITLA